MNARRNIVDYVVYAGILACSITSYAQAHHSQGLDETVSLIYLVFNILFASALYLLLKVAWNRWLRKEVLLLLMKEEETYSGTHPVQEPAVTESRPAPEHIQKKRDTLAARTERQIEIVHRYCMKYLEGFISEAQAETLLQNIRASVHDREATLTPVLKSRIRDYSCHDIFHLCHAIGKYLETPWKNDHITDFVKGSFPCYTEGLSDATIYAKLTYCTESDSIPYVNCSKSSDEYKEVFLNGS